MTKPTEGNPKKQDALAQFEQTLTDSRQALTALRKIGTERYRGDILNDNMKPGMKWLGSPVITVATGALAFTQLLDQGQLSTLTMGLGLTSVFSLGMRLLPSLGFNYRYHSVKRGRDYKNMHYLYSEEFEESALKSLDQLPALSQDEKEQAQKSRRVRKETNKLAAEIRKSSTIAQKYQRRVNRTPLMRAFEYNKRQELKKAGDGIKNKGHQPRWFDELLSRAAADGQELLTELQNTLSLPTKKRGRTR